MATETGPDLTFAQQQVIQVTMDDSCRITRAGDGSVVYDGTTHPQHASPGGGGRCSLRESASLGNPMGPGDDSYQYDYVAGVPVDVTTVEEGDQLEILTSRRDPQAVGRIFHVGKVKVGTMLVSRSLGLNADAPSRRWDDGGWDDQ